VRNALEATAFLKDLAGLAEARSAKAGPQVRQDPQAGLMETPLAWSRAQLLEINKSFSHRHALAALARSSC